MKVGGNWFVMINNGCALMANRNEWKAGRRGRDKFDGKKKKNIGWMD